MRELTILYEGPALAGKRESIVRLAELLSDVRVETRVPVPHAPCPQFVLASDRLALTVKTYTGAAYLPELDAQLRASADAVVFVVDSQRERWEANEDRRDALAEVIAERRLPIVIQANKRDLSNRLSMAELSRLDVWGAPLFESIASKRIGLWEAFEGVLRMLAEHLGLEDEVRLLLARRRP